jgi:ribokinase
MQGLFMHVERIPKEGESVRGWGFAEPLDGGKVANVAVAAARLDAPVRLVTVLGTDERSHRWLDRFRDESIDTRAVVRFDGPMDVGPALLPPSKVPVVISVGDLSARLDGDLVRRQGWAIEDASAVVCALESPVDGVEAALDLGRGAGAVTILNPSPAEGCTESLLGRADVVVANDMEAAMLSGGITAPSEAAAAIRRTVGRGAVIVTAGADGAYLAAGDAPSVHMPAPSVGEVVDTTGAGDAFTGALAAHLVQGLDIHKSVRRAVVAASMSCLGRSTMESFPTRAALDAFMSETGA